MMSVGVWQFIIFIVVLFLIFGVPIIATKNEDTNKTIGRLKFLIWFSILLTLLIVGVFVDMISNQILTIILFVATVIFSYFFQQAVVRRARDAGRSKRLAYWAIVPVANLFICIYLLFANEKNSEIIYHQGTTFN